VGKRPGDPDHFRQWRFHTRKAGEIQPGSVAGILSGQGLEKMQLKTFGRDFSPGSFVSTGRMIRSRFRHWRFRKRKGRAMNQPGPLSF